MATKVHKGLYTVNSGELPIWANNICRWLAFELTCKMQREREQKAAAEIGKMSRWEKFIRGYPRPNYAPRFFFDNPFPQPSATDLEKFEAEYPDMAKEWMHPLARGSKASLVERG